MGVVRLLAWCWCGDAISLKDGGWGGWGVVGGWGVGGGRKMGGGGW